MLLIFIKKIPQVQSVSCQLGYFCRMMGLRITISYIPMRYYSTPIKISPSVSSLMSAGSPGGVAYRGTLYPSGRVTVGRIPRKKKTKADIEYESRRPLHTCYVRSHWHWEEGLVREYQFVEERPQTLGLSSVHNYHNPSRRKNGLKGITPKGRSTVREAAYLLQRRYGRRLGFYTLTCPYTDAESIYSYNQNIAYIQRSYFQEVRREFERIGCTFSYVSVYEYQTARFDTTGFPVLHIHYCSPCYIPGTWEWICTADTLRDIWRRCCFNAIGIQCQTSAAVDAAVVHSSAAGYLSKYMSKGGEDYAFLAQNAPSQFPSQWWSCSRNLKLAIKRTVVNLPGQLCEYLIYNDTSNPSNVLYTPHKRFVYITYMGQEMCCGLSGRFSPDVADSIRPSRLFFVLGELL